MVVSRFLRSFQQESDSKICDKRRESTSSPLNISAGCYDLILVSLLAVLLGGRLVICAATAASCIGIGRDTVEEFPCTADTDLGAAKNRVIYYSCQFKWSISPVLRKIDGWSVRE